MKNLIFGIDGGGTKSHLAVFDQTGQCLAFSKHGPLNHEVMEGSYTQLESELSTLINETLSRIDATVEDISFAVMGIAGVDTEKQQQTVSAIFNRIGVANYILLNDAYLGVPAGCPGGVGICAINGTGSSMAAIDHSGTTMQVGGIGSLTNDCGGGSWFGNRLLGLVYSDLFKCGTKTIMTQYLLDELEIKHKSEYIEKVTAALDNGTLELAYLNRHIFKAAGEGDEAALRILNESADHYVGGIAYLAANLNFPPDKTLHITLAGSNFVREEVRILPDLITAKVKEKLKSHPISFNTLKTVPVAGAVYLAAQKAGFSIDIKKISNELITPLK